MISPENYLRYSPFFAKAYSMSDLEWEKLQDKIDNLSHSLYDVLISPKSSEFLRTLGTNNNLSEIQIVDLAATVRDLIMTEIYLGDIIARIQIKLGISFDQASRMANAVTSDLLGPVLAEIKKLHAEKFSTTKSSGEPQQIPSLHEQNIGNVIDLRIKK